MPPRRRVDKRRRRVDPDLFLFSDGVTPFLAGDETFENAFLARAAWDQVRHLTWAIHTRGIGPPQGAISYDGITERTVGLKRPETLEGLREAVAIDIAAVEAFRKAEPAKAATIAEELDQYVEDLNLILSAGEDGGIGQAWDVWIALETRRRYSS